MKNQIRFSVLSLSWVLFTLGSNASFAAGDLDPYFTVGAPEITVTDDSVDAEAAVPVALASLLEERPAVCEAALEGAMDGDRSTFVAFDDTIVIIDQIINLGQKIWTVVEKNKPVVAVSTQTANALPKGALRWDRMEGWKPATSKVYRIAYKNLYGMTVVDFSFRLLYTHGGSVNGQGRYLTNVTIVPGDLSVAWAYKFSSDLRVADVVNTGTRQNPVAGMELQLNWQIDTVVKHQRQSASFFIQGDGKFINLTNGG